MNTSLKAQTYAIQENIYIYIYIYKQMCEKSLLKQLCQKCKEEYTMNEVIQPLVIKIPRRDDMPLVSINQTINKKKIKELQLKYSIKNLQWVRLLNL